jgi:CxC2 like cysteine cluster associated with KDZ transposases
MFQEGDEDTADAIFITSSMVETDRGPEEVLERRPMWLNSPEPAPGAETATLSATEETELVVPDMNTNEDSSYADHTAEIPTPGNRRTQQDYLQQFVERVHPMLDALLSRQAAGLETRCPNCESGQVPRWRCRDCTSPRLLCRGCMRLTHRDNPLHRIEVWMGRYFRTAALWEVGGYLLVPHHTDTGLCDTLIQEIGILDTFQQRKDSAAQVPPRVSGQSAAADVGPTGAAAPGYAAETSTDATFMQGLDRMYRSDAQVPENDQHIYEEDDQDEPDMDELTLPVGYLPEPDSRGHSRTGNDGPGTYSQSGNIPRMDAMAHPFVRVVHTNGIHHIALVSCGCRGEETTHADLMAARFVPTSFVRYRTLFTHQVLDDFRLANLECKASAYQYFQKLRRHTSAMAPESVPNLYHELRRMSRLWRWMKKLKWAGFGHHSRGHAEVDPGSLAIFCPACPQPGVNLPEQWELDPRRWVYQRSFVADGNFKADHVRQKNAESDVWLSEGGGMMSKRTEYEDFLRTAIERVTVSGAILTQPRPRLRVQS